MKVERSGVRLSHTPRRPPEITQVLMSSARSEDPEMQAIDSINSQNDFSMRTADLFDGSTSEDQPKGRLDGGSDSVGLKWMARKPIAKVRRRTQPLPISESFVTRGKSRRCLPLSNRREKGTRVSIRNRSWTIFTRSSQIRLAFLSTVPWTIFFELISVAALRSCNERRTSPAEAQDSPRRYQGQMTINAHQ